MSITTKDIKDISQETGFRPEMLEKVIRLTTLLNSLNQHPELKKQWVLKGGTGLNLFYFDLPRLSVDIDINYIGAIDRTHMENLRPKIDQLLIDVCKQSDFEIDRTTKGHALTKIQLKYTSVLGGRGEIQIDMSYLYRKCIFPHEHLSTNLLNGVIAAKDIPILDIHEIAAGKLAALLSRHKSRDLFDAAQLEHFPHLTNEKLKLCSIIFLAADGKQWHEISEKRAEFRPSELKNQLIPTLNLKNIAALNQKGWQADLLQDSSRFIERLLPFTENEKIFFDLCNKEGVINSEFITDNKEMQNNINTHPALLWQIQKLKKYANNQTLATSASTEKIITLSDNTTRKLIAFVKCYLSYQKAVEERFNDITDEKSLTQAKQKVTATENVYQKIAKSIVGDKSVWAEVSNVKNSAISGNKHAASSYDMSHWADLEKNLKQHLLSLSDLDAIKAQIMKGTNFKITQKIHPVIKL